MKQTILFTMGLLVLLIVACVQQIPEEKSELKKFSSMAELKDYLKDNQGSSSGYYGFGVRKAMAGDMVEAVAEAAPQAAGADDFSTTNIQVEGVDEADIVKNDGKYIYVVSGNKIVIVDAYPAEDAEILSEIELEGTPNEIFINDDKLIVFGQIYNKETFKSIRPTGPESFINIYDVSDREYPEIEREFSLDGNYYDSRMIGDYIYVIVNQYIYYRDDQPIPLPAIREGAVEKTIPANEIYYFPMPDNSHQYTHIVSVNTQDKNEDPETKVFLMGSTQNMFVSKNNIYVTYIKRYSNRYYWDEMVKKVFIPALPADVQDDLKAIMKSDKSIADKQNEVETTVQNYYNRLNDEDQKREIEDRIGARMRDYQDDLRKQTQKTAIHKIQIQDGEIEYITQGEVPGTVLNQFSMDEYKGNFRIATTISGYSNNIDTSTNNMYVLDADLYLIGGVEEIAPGESIYSVRFMGDRAYMVTFKHVDPLFVIDLEDPYNPKILGKLKIPGYSDYLHPYDENHLIGIGKEVDESIDADKVHTEGAVYYTAIQGVKLAIFDVSDVSNPIEMYKEVIGDRGTESLATSEHKAFLFDKEKELLVVPMTVAELKEGQPKNQEGEFTFQGAYVYTINLEEGFDLRGRVSHVEDEETYLKSGYYFRSPYSIKRSLYMDDVLYTISDKAISMNDLDDLEDINKVELPFEQEEPKYYIE